MLEKLSVLIVDDSHDMLELLRRNMEEIGLSPYAASTVVDAIDILETSKTDLVITDLNMPGIGGQQLIKYMSQHYPNIPILVVTGYPDVQNAVEVMKLGVMEYLTKPFTFEELKSAVSSIINKIEMPFEDDKEEEVQENFYGLIGKSNSMQKIYKTIDRIKNNKATVLISGESGTGKEVVARAIHYNSSFSSSPFVPVNLGSIPDQLVESELFGHLKGAFTGAMTTRAGFFQAADGGTLFLDEIGNASLQLQAKLLRAIQEKEVTMLGGTKSQKINVRIISATNSDLKEMIEKEKFREDLYYRLNVITIQIPPLRERSEDIPLFIDYFNKKYSKEAGEKKLKISDKVLGILMKYSWPGNVRELENFMHRAVIMNDERITVDDIPDNMKIAIPQMQEDVSQFSLEEVERRHIEKILFSVNNNKTKAAEILGIDRKTLRKKLE